jgi:hypothetical protein
MKKKGQRNGREEERWLVSMVVSKESKGAIMAGERAMGRRRVLPRVVHRPIGTTN